MKDATTRAEGMSEVEITIDDLTQAAQELARLRERADSARAWSARWKAVAKRKDMAWSWTASGRHQAECERDAALGERHPGIACAFCDMGGAGYSSRGDGHHDDMCAVKDAQLALAEHRKFKEGM